MLISKVLIIINCIARHSVYCFLVAIFYPFSSINAQLKTIAFQGGQLEEFSLSDRNSFGSRWLRGSGIAEPAIKDAKGVMLLPNNSSESYEVGSSVIRTRTYADIRIDVNVVLPLSGINEATPQFVEILTRNQSATSFPLVDTLNQYYSASIVCTSTSSCHLKISYRKGEQIENLANLPVVVPDDAQILEGRLSFESIGGSLKVCFKENICASTQDQRLKNNGHVGVRMSSGSIIDNFSFWNIAPLPQGTVTPIARASPSAVPQFSSDFRRKDLNGAGPYWISDRLLTEPEKVGIRQKELKSLTNDEELHSILARNFSTKDVVVKTEISIPQSGTFTQYFSVFGRHTPLTVSTGSHYISAIACGTDFFPAHTCILVLAKESDQSSDLIDIIDLPTSSAIPWTGELTLAVIGDWVYTCLDSTCLTFHDFQSIKNSGGVGLALTSGFGVKYFNSAQWRVGDLNFDRCVDILDYSVWANYAYIAPLQISTILQGDVNGDQMVNKDDFRLIAVNGGQCS